MSLYTSRPSDKVGGGVGGGGDRSSRPWEKRGARPQKNIFPARVRASVWSKNRGGRAPRAPPLDPPLLIEEMFSTLTERKTVLKCKALIHIFNMCCLRIFCFAWPISSTTSPNPNPNPEQRIKILMFCYWYLLPLELGTEIIQFDNQGRICGAQRRKFVKIQIKPNLRTSFEVSKWALLKRFLPGGKKS